jgi:hypothetical protein
VTGQITTASGLPETPIYLAAVTGTGVTGSIRPSLTGAPLHAAPAGLHLNPAAYKAPVAGEWGDAGRNSITGPGQFVFKWSVAAELSFEGPLQPRFSGGFNEFAQPRCVWSTRSFVPASLLV